MINSMKFLILITFIFTAFVPVLSKEHVNYKNEDFGKIKLMKIEYLNKRINCVKASNNLVEMKSCWGKKKK